jgi:pyrroloquinoline-quinone synthase
VDEAQDSPAVEQITPGPALVPVQPPDLEIRVDRHGVLDLEFFDGTRDHVAVAAERVAGRVHADHAQAEAPVALVPLLQVRERAERVDAGEVPELDQHRLADQAVHSQEGDVDPVHARGELGRVDLDVLGRPHGAVAWRLLTVAVLQGRTAVDFFDRLDAARQRWNVLEHSFYVRWSAGELSREELGFYAGEYRHAVVALADAVRATGESRHAAEEEAHVALWDQFGDAVGGARSRPPQPETERCVEAWTAGRDVLESLVASFAIESGQPAISRTKLEGLVEHYGVEEGPATEYFALHAQLDVEHAAHSRALIEERLNGADQERLLEVAEGALRGNWELLDGVERCFARTSG